MQIKFDFSSKKGVLVVKFAFATAILKIETLRMRRHFACVPAGPGRIVVNNATVLPVCLWKEDNSDYRLFGNFYLQALLSSCQGADILFLQASQYCHSVNRNHCSRNYFLCFKSVGRENVSQIFHRKLWNFEKANAWRSDFRRSWLQSTKTWCFSKPNWPFLPVPEEKISDCFCVELVQFRITNRLHKGLITLIA